ncbi:MAG: hypothetical protein Q4A10_01880 [Aerococcaceae bacterium]|nr:hypothetical protein [Aerococcaceae bacterium]
MTSIGPILEPKPVPVPVPGRKVEIGESEKEKWRELYKRHGEPAVNTVIAGIASVVILFGASALISAAIGATATTAAAGILLSLVIEVLEK